MMPFMTTKRPTDPNQLAKMIVDIATGQTTDTTPIKNTGEPKGPPAKS
jgi:hypothetical protein